MNGWWGDVLSRAGIGLSRLSDWFNERQGATRPQVGDWIAGALALSVGWALVRGWFG